MFTCLMSLSLGDSTNALGWELGSWTGLSVAVHKFGVVGVGSDPDKVEDRLWFPFDPVA